MEPSDEREECGPFEAYANECINFRLVGLEECSLESTSFQPEFTHKLFGEEEKISGYRELKVDIWLQATSFLAYVDSQYRDKLQRAGPRKKVDDLTAIFKEHFPGGLVRSKDVLLTEAKTSVEEFTTLLHAQGRRLVEETGTACYGDKGTSEVWTLPLSHPDVQKWHSRIQPLFLFFIETAQAIDSSDTQWELLVAVEHPPKGGAGPMVVVGLATVFRFFHWPDSIRLRVSQVLVLPPFQGCGHGRRLLEGVQAMAAEAGVFDVTFEDPTDELQGLRDSLDAARMQALPCVQAALAGALAAGRAAAPPAEGADSGGGPRRGNPLALRSSVVEAVRGELKLHRKQVLRCWEIVLQSSPDMSNPSLERWLHMLIYAGVCRENGGGAEGDSGIAGKVIQDKEEEDNKTMFIMMRPPKRARREVPEGSNGNAVGLVTPAVESESPEDQAQKKEALKSLFDARLEFIQMVANKIKPDA